MPAEVVMPRLSDTMEEGKVLKWLKKEGERVNRGEPIAEIETDKAAMELESYDSGTVSKIVVPEGETVPVGQTIALISTTAETPAVAAAPPIRAPEAPMAAEKPAQPQPAKAAGPEQAQAKVTGEARIKASPLAKRIAEEHGIDLSEVRGSGPEGRITKEDVQAFIQQAEVPRPPGVARPTEVARPAEAPPIPAAEDRGSRLVDATRMQATIAERMTKAKQTVPHFYVVSSIEMTAAARLLEDLKAAWSAGQEVGQDVGYTDLIVKAVALAMKKFPIVNAFYHDGQLQYNERINIGIAVAVPEGLMVPVVHDCDRKSLREIAADARRVIESVRTGHMTPDDFEGGTFTVSNLGRFDVDHFAAIINPPESGILAVSSITPSPVVRHNQIAIADIMKVALSTDHRVYYGATAAQFLQEVKRLLEMPVSLLI